MAPAPEASAPAPVVQRKQADGGRFRLQVDRQTKASYATYEAAEAAGKAIKKDYPILQVAALPFTMPEPGGNAVASSV